MVKNNYGGKFIVFEGLDGSGQTTQVNLLGKFLEGNSCKVFLTKEPTKVSEAGEKINDILNRKVKIPPLELQKIFAEDRKRHLEDQIVPALKEKKIVISDRYFFSSFAYGAADGAKLEDIIEINDNFLIPDLTIILKVRPDVCIERIKKRGIPQTLFEEKEKLAKVWNYYEKFPTIFENVMIINGESSIEDISKEVKEIVLEILSK